MFDQKVTFFHGKVQKTFARGTKTSTILVLVLFWGRYFVYCGQEMGLQLRDTGFEPRLQTKSGCCATSQPPIALLN
jgi:hypothetical protein